MMSKNSYILFIMMILFTSSFVPYSFASIESEALEDVLAGCRDGQTLVYRAAYLDYVCVDPSTAERWVELGLAEIAKEAVEFDPAETIETPKPLEESEFPGAPPPAPKPTERDTSDDSECREGYVLVYRFIHHDTFCTSPATAFSWERLGLAEIVSEEKPEKVELAIDITSSDKIEEIIDDSSVESEQEQSVESEQEQSVESEQEQSVESEQEQSVESEQEQSVESEQEQSVESEQEQSVESEQEQSVETQQVSDPSDYPKIRLLDEGIWAVFAYDGSSSVLIEGKSGIIAIDSITQYESSKKAIDEFKNIVDKPIKTIIFSKISPEIILASEALINEGDGTVETIISEDLLDNYYDDYDSNFNPTHKFNRNFSLDISGVQMSMIFDGGSYSDQTYLYLPDYDRMIIGDSEYGVFPSLLDVSSLVSFSD